MRSQKRDLSLPRQLAALPQEDDCSRLQYTADKGKPPNSAKFTESETLSAPVTINLSHCKYRVVEKMAKELGWKIIRNNKEPWDLLWSDTVY